MKSIYNYLTGSFCLIAALMLAMGCSDEYKYETDYSSYKDVKLKVNLTDDNNVLTVKLANGTHAVTIGVTPEEIMIDAKAYIYSLSDETVATISQDGTLTLLKEGETELTARFRGNQDIRTTCTVKVIRDKILVSDVKVPESVTVQEFKRVNLAEQIIVLPASADNPVLSYASADTGIATVDANGIVTGVKEGLTTITATTTDGTEISKEVAIHVVGEVKVSAIELNAASALNGKTVAIGQVFDLGAAVSVSPANASNPDVTYSLVSGEGVVSLDEHGKVKTLADGEARIKIAAADGHGAEATVTLKVDADVKFFERALWFVDTSIVYANGKNYTTDGSTGNPEHLIDGKTGTYLALTKPGKKYNVEVTPADHILFFVVDMGAEQEFNYFQYVHRNTTTNFQAFKISMFGSNDNEHFTAIEEDIAVGPATTSAAVTYEQALALSSYRYIKVVFRDWNKNGGLNITVAEFNVSKR